MEHNDPKIKPQAHSDSYWEPIDTFGHRMDVMLECKHKEKGLFRMRQLLEEECVWPLNRRNKMTDYCEICGCNPCDCHGSQNKAE